MEAHSNNRSLLTEMILKALSEIRNPVEREVTITHSQYVTNTQKTYNIIHFAGGYKYISNDCLLIIVLCCANMRLAQSQRIAAIAGSF